MLVYASQNDLLRLLGIAAFGCSSHKHFKVSIDGKVDKWIKIDSNLTIREKESELIFVSIPYKSFNLTGACFCE